MYYYVPTRHPVLARDTELCVERRLPVSGEVKARPGDRVEPDTVVAVADWPGRPFLVPIARELDLEPAKARKQLTKQPEATVTAGETLARRRRGLRAWTVKSPAAGTLTQFDPDSGVATIVPPSQRVELTALVAGTIDEVEPGRGVTIRAFGSRFFGAFGVGKETFGVSRVSSQERQQPLAPEAIDSRAARSVLVAGGTVSAAALRKAADVGVKGLIVGSIEESELLAFLGLSRRVAWRTGLPDWQLLGAANSPLTIVVTEGFGTTPMAAPLYETLAAGNGGQVSLTGITQLTAGLRRPEVYLYGGSGRGADSQEPPVATLAPGTLVRLVDHEHLGAVGTIRDAPRRRLVARDVVADAVEVELPATPRLVVPLANLEVLA